MKESAQSVPDRQPCSWDNVNDAQTHVYRSVDGCDLAADVYLPTRPGGRSPVVMWLHGGALIFGSRKDITPAHLHEWLNEGYVVVSVDYRLAPETKLPALFTDVECAYRWIQRTLPRLSRTELGGIAVVGQSAGGYLSLLAACRLSPRPSAIVSLYGYGDINAPWYSQPDPYYCRQPGVSHQEAVASVGTSPLADAPGNTRSLFYLYCRQRGRWPQEVAGFSPTTQAEELAAWCPVLHIDEHTPPVLLLHGDEDTDVPCGQSIQMAQALARARRRHRLILLPGEPHGFDNKTGSTAAALAVRSAREFIDEHLVTT
jgi:acetyl esterase/lipase